MEIEQLPDGTWRIRPYKYVMAGKGKKAHIQPYLWLNTACFADLPTTPLEGNFRFLLCKKCAGWLMKKLREVKRLDALEALFQAEGLCAKKERD